MELEIKEKNKNELEITNKKNRKTTTIHKSISIATALNIIKEKTEDLNT